MLSARLKKSIQSEIDRKKAKAAALSAEAKTIEKNVADLEALLVDPVASDAQAEKVAETTAPAVEPQNDTRPAHRSVPRT